MVYFPRNIKNKPCRLILSENTLNQLSEETKRKLTQVFKNPEAAYYMLCSTVGSGLWAGVEAV